MSPDQPILRCAKLSKRYGKRDVLNDIHFELYPGEVLAIVGESGSGKSTLLRCLCAQANPERGSIEYLSAAGVVHDLVRMQETSRLQLCKAEFGFVYQNPLDGLRMGVSAGANIGERLMAQGARNYGNIRQQALTWLERVEIDVQRIDDLPSTFSGGMQQRLQIARNLVSNPRILFMDEPTSGLDVSVQAKLLDLLRSLCRSFNLTILLVTHDLAVARLLADQMLVIHQGCVVESGLTDQVLDDPQHAYTQLLVSSVLQP